MDRIAPNEIFSDLELVLTDKHTAIHIRTHRIILCQHSNHFVKLLTGSLKEAATISIEVIDAYVAYDVIKSFYLHTTPTNLAYYPGWKHSLLSYRILENFEIEYVFDTTMMVSEADFARYLNMVEGFGWYYDTVYLTLNNLPEYYDLNKLSVALLRAMKNLLDDDKNNNQLQAVSGGETVDIGTDKKLFDNKGGVPLTYSFYRNFMAKWEKCFKAEMKLCAKEEWDQLVALNDAEDAARKYAVHKWEQLNNKIDIAIQNKS